MKGSDSSMNQQFNEQYAGAIETVQARAIWRVGEHVTELDEFRYRCPKCGIDGLHQRFDIARHRLLFGRSIRQIEAARPMIRCRRCGHQRHVRDVDELVVPTTIALRGQALAALAADRTAPLGDTAASAVAAFGDEASPPLGRGLVVEIAEGCGPQDAEFVETLARALLLPRDQIADIVSTLG